MKTLQEHLRDLYVSHGISHIQKAADRIDALEKDISTMDTAQEIALTSLYEFQEATKCDSGAQAAERIKALKKQRDALADELRDVLDWARIENAPLREQELASIRGVLAECAAIHAARSKT